MASDYRSISLAIQAVTTVTFKSHMLYNSISTVCLLYALIGFRLLIVVYVQVVIIMIICTTNLASSLGVGLILNFSAGAIVCELDKMAMKSFAGQQFAQKYGPENFLKYKIMSLVEDKGGCMTKIFYFIKLFGLNRLIVIGALAIVMLNDFNGML